MLPTRRGSHWARQNRRSRNLMEHSNVPLNRGIIAETGIIPPGYNLIRDTFNFEVIETKNTMIEGRDGQGMPVTRVSGLIQMGDKENANGRYYSTNEVLAPAVRDIQEDVRSRAVMGEYDHPCITSKEFDVLTPSGWKKFTDIAVGDVVYSRVNGEIVESTVNGIVDKPFHGEVYRFDGRFIDTCFTGDHKVIMDSENDGPVVQSECTVSELISDRERYNKHRIPINVEGVETLNISLGAVNIIPEQYSGNVYCLITEHGSFYMRHNDYSFWTGNCDAKIHLDRVSHLMSKVWMDGRKVYGEAEILHNLPCGACLRGLFEHKVRVGISSRGVGDMEVVENAGKELYRVMPGYAFVTWDAVAEPSVNGAILQIQEGLNRRLRPIKQERNRFSPDAYNSLLVAEINRYFDI